MPKIKNKSPSLLTIIAFKPALLADILEFQKLIKRKEEIPTPSQESKNKQKFEDVTSKFIKKKNKYK